MARYGISILAISFLLFAQSQGSPQQMQNSPRDTCMYRCYRLGEGCNRDDARCWADRNGCLQECDQNPR